MALLEVKNLRVNFPIKGGILGRTIGYTHAVDDVSFSIEPGQTLGLVGESGSGKSTTGRAILGLHKLSGGSIFFDGEHITRYIGKNRSEYRKNVQMIFQDAYSSLNPRKRVLDIIAEPMRNFLRQTRAEETHRVHELLDIVGMTADAAAKYPFEFSGGQRQRIGVARAIALGPKLIVADEPVSALDLSVQAQVLNYLKEIQQRLGLTYLFISHDLSVVRHMCDNIAIMHNGRLVEMGECETIYNASKHIYTRRLIAAIPDTNPDMRDASAAHRRRLNAEYDATAHMFYDEKGRVFDLQDSGGGHFVAMPAVRSAS